ncbi:potassium transporter [Ignatzschineria ureiclastica]|uniref:Trimethylamine monooxygenase n=1 Tax=Ignatzschineria ureiclastica TaxID=472582 RepID=A0A2U2ADG2_9GAMM|nr:NAD(P)/FAD-dependent oxidoreductase [Ignatzschineria ureiclastica]PWD80691.1 potassium transporter [Ignatzschineria ureiclastica]GGZ95304.1 oxidoreductase [Ignatzschineria ureiclastica]
MNQKKKIAILGAGPSGLAQLRAFQALKNQGQEIPEIVCYEKQDDWGGVWRYNWETSVDHNGEPIHGCMYRFLWINAPKEALEFGDYTFDEHFKEPIPSYVPRAVLKDYIVSRVERDNIRDYIRFNHAVRWVEYLPANEKFRVTVMDHTQDRLITNEFDYVVCATGHFSTPYLPQVEGLEDFSGRVIHSHEFRDAREFKDQDILIVGSSYSAEDIGTQCYKYGAKSITFSYRTNPIGHDWPPHFEERPLLLKAKGRTAYFKDGSHKDFDAIIFCTGYRFNFNFLSEDIRLKAHNSIYPADLYKGIFLIDHPKMIYLGMQDQYYTFNMFDTQAWYARDVIMGRIQLPNRETMIKDSQAWIKKLQQCQTSEDNIDFQASYIQDLLEATDYPDFHVFEQGLILKSWQQDKKEDIMGFRNKSYSSTITGTLAACLPKPWIEIMDDSYKSFMKQEFIPAEEDALESS